MRVTRAQAAAWTGKKQKAPGPLRQRRGQPNKEEADFGRILSTWPGVKRFVFEGVTLRIANGARFVTTESATISGGTATIPIRAEDTGPVEAEADAITEIVTAVSGWSGISASTEISSAEGNLGRDVETDEELRVRREQSLAIVGAGVDQAIRARLLQVPGVDAAVVLSNRTKVTDVNGIPANSFRAVIYPTPADNDPVWQAIWETMPSGILADGTTAGTAIDSQGNSQPVAFSVATEQEIHIDVLITSDPDEWPDDGEDQALRRTLRRVRPLAPRER